MANKKKASKKKPNYVLLSTYGAAPSYGAFAQYQDGGDVSIDPPANKEEYKSYLETWRESMEAQRRYTLKAKEAEKRGDKEAFTYYTNMYNKAKEATVNFAPKGPSAVIPGETGFKWDPQFREDEVKFRDGGELRKLVGGGSVNLAAGTLVGEGIEAVGTTDTGRVSVGAQAASGAAKGAAMGAMLGPWGAVAGGVIGGGVGLVKGLAEKKNEESEQDAAKKAEEERLAAEKVAAEKAAAQAGYQERVTAQQTAMAGSADGQDQAGYGVDMMKDGGNVGPRFEAEGGEVMQFNQGGLAKVYGDGNVSENSSDAVKINGNSHEEGGVKMDSTGEARIFSDHLKSKEGKGKKTFAELADILTKEKGKLEKNAKPGDQAAANTAKYMNKELDFKLDSLYNEQEAQKADKDAKELSRLSNNIMTNNNGDVYVDESKVNGFMKAADKRGMAPEQLVGKLMKEGGAIPKYNTGGGIGPGIDYTGGGYSSTDGVAYNADGSVNYDMSIANMQNIQNPNSAPASSGGIGMGGMSGLYALPSIGYNLYQGIWGKTDYAKAGRAGYADLSGKLRAQGDASGILRQAQSEAGKAEQYNPSAELAQAEQAAATARQASRRAAGGNLGAAMRGALSAQRMEGALKTQVQGRSELSNLQARERANQRVQALRQLQASMGMRMADTVGQQEIMNYQTDLFNIGQEYRTEQNRLAAEAAKRAHLSKAFEQIGAFGQAQQQNAMAAAQLAAMSR